MASSYIRILILGMFITLAYNICANTLRAIGDSVTPLVFLVLASFVNVALDYLFIMVCGWGVAGAAAATVAAQLLSVVLCTIHIRRRVAVLSIRRSHFKLEADQVWEMLSAGLSMGMMSSLVNFGTLDFAVGDQSAWNGGDRGAYGGAESL